MPPIFRGVLEANEIELQRPTVRLALEKDDGWNWQSFGQALGNAAYLPSNIALTSVKIADGTLAVHGPDGTERTRFTGINGELSAPALPGPYRFRGTYGQGQAEREIKIATAVPEPDKMLGIVGVIPNEMVMGLKANGLPPLALHGPPIPPNVVAVFAPDATDAVIRDLVQYGMPILTDHAPDDLDRATRMMALGIADVVPKPLQVGTLATKVQRAIKKAARRAR